VSATPLKLLLIQPYYEDATFYWGDCLRALINKGIVKPEPGFLIYTLWGSETLPDNVYQALQDPDVVGVSGLGAAHGNVCVYTGQYSTPIFQCGSEKNGLLKGKYWNPVSCLVGGGLVPELVQKWGVPAACGEITEYWFVTYGGEEGWENDPTASFILANWAFDLALMKGMTAGEAYKAMLDAYKAEAEKWRKKDPEVSYYIIYDAENRQFFGDPNWKITTQPPPPPPPPQGYTCPWCGFQSDNATVMQTHIIANHCPPCPAPKGTYSGAAEGKITEGIAEGYVQWGARQYKITLNSFNIPVLLGCEGEWWTGEQQSFQQIQWQGKSKGTATGRAEGYMQFGPFLKLKVVLDKIQINVETEDSGTAQEK